jgi:hypothetical protein
MVVPSVLVSLKPVLDIMFGFGAIVIFGEILFVIYHSVTYRFTAVRIVELIVYGFLFAICLDWLAGFNFFENTVAPIIWSILNKAF